MSTCKQCGKQFTGIRSTATFCTPACRVRYNRNNTTPSDTVTSATVTTGNAKGCYGTNQGEIADPAQSSRANVTKSDSPQTYGDSGDCYDPTADASPIYHKTQGKVSVPGDPGYSGCCRQVSGVWLAPSQIGMVGND